MITRSRIYATGVAMVFGTAVIGFAGAASAGAMAESATAMTRSEAQKQITDDNYTNVSDLQQVTGGWTAKAEEGNKPVSLMVSDLRGVMIQ